MAEPANKYPSVFPRGSLFDLFPYSPPCLLLGCISLTALFCIIFFLPETRGRVRAAVHVSKPVTPKVDGGVEEGLVPKEGGVGKVEVLADMAKVAKVAEVTEQEREPSAFQLFFRLPTCESGRGGFFFF